MLKDKSLFLLILIFMVSCGGGGSNGLPPISPNPASLDFSMNAPTELSDYELFTITVTPLNLNQGENVSLSLLDPNGNLLFPVIENTTLKARAPFTYTETVSSFTLKLTSSTNREATKHLSIPVRFKHVAQQFNTPDGLLNFTPSSDIQEALQNENYASWDILPWLRGERKKLPAGTYCYPTPNDCSYQSGEWPPGFIPADIVPGDFDGDGDQDVIFVADIGDRVFKSLGSDEDPSILLEHHSYTF